MDVNIYGFDFRKLPQIKTLLKELWLEMIPLTKIVSDTLGKEIIIIIEKHSQIQYQLNA